MMPHTIDEIETAVAQLSVEQLADFRKWFSEYDSQQWDNQIEKDIVAGRLDNLADEALRDFQQGRTTSR